MSLPSQVWREERLQRLLGRLRLAAAAGEACPRNDDIAELLRLASTAQIPGMLDELAARGLIWIERGGNARVVGIVATGQRTSGTIAKPRTTWRVAAPPGSPPSRVRDERDEPRLSAREIAARRVERGTCPRCGARLDAGCGHRSAPFGLSTSGLMGLSYA
jgi:hypothetical protein